MQAALIEVEHRRGVTSTLGRGFRRRNWGPEILRRAGPVPGINVAVVSNPHHTGTAAAAKRAEAAPLIRNAEHLKRHSGDVSFHGGSGAAGGCGSFKRSNLSLCRSKHADRRAISRAAVTYAGAHPVIWAGLQDAVSSSPSPAMRLGSGDRLAMTQSCLPPFAVSVMRRALGPRS